MPSSSSGGLRGRTVLSGLGTILQACLHALWSKGMLQRERNHLALQEASTPRLGVRLQPLAVRGEGVILFSATSHKSPACCFRWPFQTHLSSHQRAIQVLVWVTIQLITLGFQLAVGRCGWLTPALPTFPGQKPHLSLLIFSLIRRHFSNGWGRAN